MNIKRAFFAALVAMLVWVNAASAKVGSIYWLSDPKPCVGGWGAPVLSSYLPPCAGGTWSICPGTAWDAAGAFNGGQAITITGVSATHILSNPLASGYFVIGSFHIANDGPDVFITGGGVGTHTVARTVPVPFSQGSAGAPLAHFDVYAACSAGTDQMLIEIDYTAP